MNWKSSLKFFFLDIGNGGYSTWSSFSSCSKSCDIGVEVRTRTCTNPTPLGAGKDCREYGLDKEERKCNIEPCIGKKNFNFHLQIIIISLVFISCQNQ